VPGSARVPLALLVSLLVTASEPIAHAQERPQKSKYGPLRLGPFYLTPRVGVTAGVDSNVYNTPTPISDESVTVTPILQVVLPIGRRLRLKGTGGIAPQYFHRESSQRFTDLFGNVLGEVDAGPLTVFGGVGGGRYRQRFSLEIDERILRHETSNTFGGTLHLGQRAATTVSQTSVTSTFDPEATVEGRPVSTALDRDTVTRRGEISVALTRKTALVPSVDLQEDRFLRQTVGLPSRVRSQRYLIGFQFGKLAFLSGRVAAGLRHYGAREGVAPYDGLALVVDVGMPFVLGTRLQLSSSRDVSYGATPSQSETLLRNTYVSSLYRGEVSFELPLRLHGRTSVSYAEARYLQPADSGVGATPRRDHAWTVGAALLRHFGGHLSLGGTVQRGQRISPISGHNYAGTMFGLAGEWR